MVPSVRPLSTTTVRNMIGPTCRSAAPVGQMMQIYPHLTDARTAVQGYGIRLICEFRVDPVEQSVGGPVRSSSASPAGTVLRSFTTAAPRATLGPKQDHRQLGPDRVAARQLVPAGTPDQRSQRRPLIRIDRTQEIMEHD